MESATGIWQAFLGIFVVLKIISLLLVVAVILFLFGGFIYELVAH